MYYKNLLEYGRNEKNHVTTVKPSSPFRYVNLPHFINVPLFCPFLFQQDMRHNASGDFLIEFRMWLCIYLPRVKVFLTFPLFCFEISTLDGRFLAAKRIHLRVRSSIRIQLVLYVVLFIAISCFIYISSSSFIHHLKRDSILLSDIFIQTTREYSNIL